MSAFAVKQFLNVSTDGDIADELGALRAQAKEIADQAAFLEGLLKSKGTTVAEGKRFRVSISYGVETKRTDWKAVAMKLNALPMLIDLFTKVSVSDRVRVTAPTKR